MELWRLWVFAAGLAVMLAAESLRAARPSRDSRARRLAVHLAMMGLGQVLLRLTAAGPLLALAASAHERGWGLVGLLGLSGPPELAFSLVALDGLIYWWHRANHELPFLWRFHKVHHVDTHLDATTSLRFHPGELMLSAGVRAVWLCALGPSPAAYALFEAAVTLASQFHHADLDLGAADARLSRLVVTPAYHAAHHTVAPRSREANYATILSGWDRLFRTYEPGDPAELRALGLPRGGETYLSLSASLAAPFSSRY